MIWVILYIQNWSTNKHNRRVLRTQLIQLKGKLNHERKCQASHYRRN